MGKINTFDDMDGDELSVLLKKYRASDNDNGSRLKDSDPTRRAKRRSEKEAGE
jgi:hypothetical protein